MSARFQVIYFRTGPRGLLCKVNSVRVQSLFTTHLAGLLYLNLVDHFVVTQIDFQVYVVNVLHFHTDPSEARGNTSLLA